MLSKPCTSPQSHMCSFLQLEKKSQCDIWDGNLPAKWLRLSRSVSLLFFFLFLFFSPGLFKRRKSGIYPSAQPRQQFTEMSLIKEAKQTQSLLEPEQPEKWRTFKKLPAWRVKPNQKRPQDAFFFLWEIFLVLLSTHNSEKSHGK